MQEQNAESTLSAPFSAMRGRTETYRNALESAKLQLSNGTNRMSLRLPVAEIFAKNQDRPT